MFRFISVLLLVILSAAASARAVELPIPDDGNRLPRVLTEGWDVSVWGWLGYDHVSPSDDEKSLWVTQVGVGVTKTFTDRIAATVDVDFIDANYENKVKVQQAFVSILLSEEHQTLLTAGRFDANFGVEPRNFWDRLTGTTSLLFGAEPQQLTGVMLTQPIGTTGLRLRPFVTAGFQAQNVPSSPSIGLTTEYSPHKTFTAAVTNWFGPGFVAGYPGNWWYYYNSPIQNWWGPWLDGRNGGSLYFLDAKIIWHPRPDLMLAGEYLFANNNSSRGRVEWDGVMFLANYDLNDHWRIFGRWSFLNDPDWIVTGNFDRRHELSGGIACQIYHGIEIRGEYRHDFSVAASDQDVVSINLSFGF